jgi:glycosyltransferase involved in cell wall biosynthesis
MPDPPQQNENSAPVTTPRPLEAERSRDTAAPVVTFVIPAYNEGRFLKEVIDRIYELPLQTRIVAVDDGSTDDTWEIMNAYRDTPGFKCFKQQVNQGKGAAIRAAMPHCDGDIVLIQDADMEYDPADVTRLVQPIVDGRADVVYGSRLSSGQPQRAYMFWHMVGNKFLALLTNILYNTTLSDMETGYKVFSGQVFRSLSLRSSDFRIEAEITAKILKQKLRLFQVPVAYYGRSYEEGKKITWRDGFPAVWTLLRYRVSN